MEGHGVRNHSAERAFQVGQTGKRKTASADFTGGGGVRIEAVECGDVGCHVHRILSAGQIGEQRLVKLTGVTIGDFLGDFPRGDPISVRACSAEVAVGTGNGGGGALGIQGFFEINRLASDTFGSLREHDLIEGGSFEQAFGCGLPLFVGGRRKQRGGVRLHRIGWDGCPELGTSSETGVCAGCRALACDGNSGLARCKRKSLRII
jgi:hypothetical protein